MHITNDPNLRRPGYVYDSNGIGTHVGSQPYINWKHVDGPLLYCSNGLLHWLTWLERLQLFFHRIDIHDLDFKHRTRPLVRKVFP